MSYVQELVSSRFSFRGTPTPKKATSKHSRVIDHEMDRCTSPTAVPGKEMLVQIVTSLIYVHISSFQQVNKLGETKLRGGKYCIAIPAIVIWGYRCIVSISRKALEKHSKHLLSLWRSRTQVTGPGDGTFIHAQHEAPFLCSRGNRAVRGWGIIIVTLH